MKTNELFQVIEKIIKEKEAWPEIIDYSLAERNPVEIEREGFDIKFDVHFGGNEGIYLSVFAEGQISDAPPGRFYMGTIKTLLEGEDALQKMSLLGASFIWEGRKYVEKNIDEFIRYGYKMVPSNTNYALYVGSKERVQQKLKYFFVDAPNPHESVNVINMKTKKEKVFTVP